MSTLSSKTSINKVDFHGVCVSDRIAESFECYQVPPSLGEEVIDPLDEHIVHSCQSVYLGDAYLKFDVLPASPVHFYKVTRSEISEPNYDIKLKRHLYCSPIQRGNDSMDPHDFDGAGALSSPERSEALLPSLSATPPLTLSQDDPNLSVTSVIPLASPPTPGDIIGTTIALPPKKRKKRRIVRHSIIFTLAKDCDPHQDLSSLPTGGGGSFYKFPQHALVDVMNNVGPFQIFCTFYLSKSTPSTFHNASRSGQYRTKSEELTTIGDSNNHQLLTKEPQHSFATDSDGQLINIEIFGASANIYHSLKETVSDYQMMCQKVERLLCAHRQHLNVSKNEITHHFGRSSMPATQEPAYHPKPNEDIEGVQPLHNRLQLPNRGEESFAPDQQNSTNIQNQYSIVKRQHNKKTCGEQGNLKITKRAYSKKKHNNTENSVMGSETSTKDCATPTIKKKSKRMSLNRDKEHSNPANSRRCFYCGVTETPMWRRGPDGGGTLCNACGVKWKNGKILSSEGTSTTVLTTDQKISSNTKLNNKEQQTSKRKLSTSDITQKRVKIADDIDTLTTRDLIMDHYPKDFGLHESTDASTTLVDHHQNRLQLYTTSSSDDIGAMDLSLAKNTKSTTHTTITKLIVPSPATKLTSDNYNRVRLSTIGSSFSSDLIGNSPPLATSSFNSSTNSSSPISKDFQNNTMSFSGKIGSQDDDAVPLTTPGADDVEAAALLTLLSQS